MLPTKLARAALAGKRCSVVPPDEVVALMTVSRMCRRQRSRVPGGGQRCVVAVLRGRGHRAGTSSQRAYVPTGYVPDGEVIGVTVSRRRAKVGKRRWSSGQRAV